MCATEYVVSGCLMVTDSVAKSHQGFPITLILTASYASHGLSGRLALKSLSNILFSVFSIQAMSANFRISTMCFLVSGLGIVLRMIHQT